MKYSKFPALLNLFAMPVVLILLGLILLLNPDAVTILVTKVIGSVLTALGVGYGLFALFTWPVRRVSRVTTAIICLAAGGFLLINPLFLAKNISRLLGILLAVEGGQNLMSNSGSRPMGVITLAIGAVMILMPMAASRLVFTLCSIVLIVIGIAQLVDRLKVRKSLDSGDDPDIIDAL